MDNYRLKELSLNRESENRTRVNISGNILSGNNSMTSIESGDYVDIGRGDTIKESFFVDKIVGSTKASVLFEAQGRLLVITPEGT